jgi:GR25 family glycosyltransferase involved in LPS biosynthesis
VKIYVINLQRRPDRRSRIAKRLERLGLDFSFVEAVDAQESEVSSAKQYIPYAYACNVRSHALALGVFLQGDDDFAMIMEDDAVPIQEIDWLPFMQSLEIEMAKNDFSYLQLGFISELYKIKLPRRIMRSLVTKMGLVGKIPLTKFYLAGHNYEIIMGESRAGAHCYIVNRRFAEAIPPLNEPVWVSIDGFYDRLASTNVLTGHFRMGRLKRSLAEQESRQDGSTQIDSDVEVTG